MYIEKENEVCPQMNTDGHGCPQADGVGEQQLFTHCQYKDEFIKLKQVPAIGQQLKKNILVEEREFMRMER